MVMENTTFINQIRAILMARTDDIAKIDSICAVVSMYNEEKVKTFFKRLSH